MKYELVGFLMKFELNSVFLAFPKSERTQCSLSNRGNKLRNMSKTKPFPKDFEKPQLKKDF